MRLIGVLAFTSFALACTGEEIEGDCKTTETASCAQQQAPEWSLTDFQPKSPRYNQRYGLEAFRGKPLLVTFYASWCPYCLRQTEQLDRLLSTLESQGTPTAIAVVNKSDALSTQAELVSRTAVPLFQDEGDVAYALHGARKDDLVIYRGDGTQYRKLTLQSGESIDLSSSEGFDNVLKALSRINSE